MEPITAEPVQPLETGLRQNVIAALLEKGYPHHRMLRIQTDHGLVIVEGVLPTYYLRQIAVECIKRVTGVRGVIDRIQVTSEKLNDDGAKLSAAVARGN